MRKWWRSWSVVAVSAAALAVVAVAAGRLTHKPNYSRIEEGLYLGGRVPAPPPGTRAVLNLSRVKDGYRAEVHCWQPIADGKPAPPIQWLRQQVQFIDRQRRAGRTVFVHCRAGISRAGLVTVAYLMWREGWSRDRALQFVRSRRPRVRPNRAFMALLLQWQQCLNGNARQPET